MIIKLTKEMTEAERLAAQNSNNQYLNCEYGTSEVNDVMWTYEKHSNGLVKMWCMVSVQYATPQILETSGIYFPFEFENEAVGFATMNEWTSTDNRPKNPRILCKNNRCTIQIHNHLNTFVSSDIANVAVFVIGQLAKQGGDVNVGN